MKPKLRLEIKLETLAWTRIQYPKTEFEFEFELETRIWSRTRNFKLEREFETPIWIWTRVWNRTQKSIRNSNPNSNWKLELKLEFESFNEEIFAFWFKKWPLLKIKFYRKEARFLKKQGFCKGLHRIYRLFRWHDLSQTQNQTLEDVKDKNLVPTNIQSKVTSICSMVGKNNRLLRLWPVGLNVRFEICTICLPYTKILVKLWVY